MKSYEQRIFGVLRGGACYSCLEARVQPKQPRRFQQMFQQIKGARGIEGKMGTCPLCGKESTVLRVLPVD